MGNYVISQLVNTIGGLLGELWLILDVLQQEQQTEIKLEEVKIIL